MTIDEKAPVITRDEIFICSTPKDVWRVFTAINNWNDWNPGITKAELKTEFKLEGAFTWRTKGMEIHATIGEIIPGQKIAWRGSANGIASIHEWDFYEVPQGVYVQSIASWSGEIVSQGAIFFQSSLSSLLKNWLESLKHKIEGKKMILISSY